LILEEFYCDFEFFVIYVSCCIVTSFMVNLILEVLVAFKLGDSLDVVREVVCLSSGDMFGKCCDTSGNFYACQGVSVILCRGSGKA